MKYFRKKIYIFFDFYLMTTWYLLQCFLLRFNSDSESFKRFDSWGLFQISIDMNEINNKTSNKSNFSKDQALIIFWTNLMFNTKLIYSLVFIYLCHNVFRLFLYSTQYYFGMIINRTFWKKKIKKEIRDFFLCITK